MVNTTICVTAQVIVRSSQIIISNALLSSHRHNPSDWRILVIDIIIILILIVDNSKSSPLQIYWPWCTSQRG